MSADSYRRYYADNHDLVLRLQAARRRAKRLGLRMVQRGSMIRLFDSAGNLVESGGLDYIKAYLGERFAPRHPGPAQRLLRATGAAELPARQRAAYLSTKAPVSNPYPERSSFRTHRAFHGLRARPR